MTGSEMSGPRNVTPLRRDGQRMLYNERFHPLQLVVELVWALIFSGCLVALAVLASSVSTIVPRFGALLHRLSTDPATSWWWWTLVVAVVAWAIYIWPRAIWRWQNTYLQVTDETTSRIRRGSVLWLSQQVRDSVPTRRIETVNVRQTIPEVFLDRVFGLNVAGITIDTAGTEDSRMHNLRYVVDAERMQQLILNRIARS